MKTTPIEILGLSIVLLTAGPSIAGLAGTTGSVLEEGTASSHTPPIQEHASVLDGTTPFNGSPADAPHGIGPGTQLLIYKDGAVRECTANFVWENETQLFLGSAGHCFLDNSQSTHGEQSTFDQSEWNVTACISNCTFGGATGVYKAALGLWITGETVELGNITYAHQEGNNGIGVDFGIAAIPENLTHLVRPELPRWGGPTSTDTPEVGERVCQYGYGIGPGETPLTAARPGVLTTVTDSHWKAAFPGSQGDSGSAVVTCEVTEDGKLRGVKAVGVFTHLSVGSSGQGLFATTAAGTTIDQAQHLAKSEANLTLELVFPD